MYVRIYWCMYNVGLATLLQMRVTWYFVVVKYTALLETGNELWVRISAIAIDFLWMNNSSRIDGWIWMDWAQSFLLLTCHRSMTTLLDPRPHHLSLSVLLKRRKTELFTRSTQTLSANIQIKEWNLVRTFWNQVCGVLSRGANLQSESQKCLNSSPVFEINDGMEWNGGDMSIWKSPPEIYWWGKYILMEVEKTSRDDDTVEYLTWKSNNSKSAFFSMLNEYVSGKGGVKYWGEIMKVFFYKSIRDTILHML